MQRAIELVHQIAANREDWTLDGRSVRIQLLPSNRSQRVDIVTTDDQIILRSTVLGRRRVTQDVKDWRNLARAAWRRNAEHDLVTFAFDRQDRLIGRISQLTCNLDRDELELYVDVLARACDRFEHMLTGADVS
jgi:hypothetical protein